MHLCSINHYRLLADVRDSLDRDAVVTEDGELTMGVAPSGEVATAATLLVRFATLWFGVALGGLALWGFHRAVRPRQSESG